MKVLVVFALVALSAVAAWPGFLSDAPDDVSTHQKQHDVNYAFYKIFEPLREPNLLEKSRSFNPVADVSMYKDEGAAVKHLMDELTHHRLLEKKHWAVATNERHLEEAIMLFEVLMQCKDWNCVTGNAAYFRERVNEEVFIYAVYHAIKHSPLTQHVVLPPIYEVKPHHFTKSQIMEEAYEAKEMKLNKVFQNNFTGTPNDIEHKIAYFREDIGVGTHHLMIHLENPFWWKDTYGYHIDRKGENFFYAYHQLLNRYEAERISNYLPPLEELKLDEPLKEGFSPQTTYKFGPPFPTRNDDIHLHDVDGLGRLHEIVHKEDRIHDAIAHGYVEDNQGNKINIENDQGIAVLGDIIQSSFYSPNRKYYGNLTTLAYAMLDHQTDPKNKYDTPPGVLAHLETFPRDPAAWRLHKRIDNIFREHIDSLPPYTKDDLEVTGIIVSDIEIQGNLETYFEEYKYDLTNALNDNSSTDAQFYGIYATMPRLNHKEFSYKIKVQNNNGDSKKSVIRILAMPYRDGNGAIIPFDEGRWLAIEMDLFVETLTPGDNEIVRKSSEASITVPDVLTYKVLAEKTEAHEDLTKYESATGIPNRLLLPKGSKEGTEFRLVVAVTDAEQDVADESIFTMEKYHHYGVHGVQPDHKPFGYPLDRRVPDEHIIEEVTNIKDIMVKVYNHNVFVALPQQ